MSGVRLLDTRLEQNQAYSSEYYWELLFSISWTNWWDRHQTCSVLIIKASSYTAIILTFISWLYSAYYRIISTLSFTIFAYYDLECDLIASTYIFLLLHFNSKGIPLKTDRQQLHLELQLHRYQIFAKVYYNRQALKMLVVLKTYVFKFVWYLIRNILRQQKHNTWLHIDNS